MPVLWIDNQAEQWRPIWRMARGEGIDLCPVYSVAEAIAWLAASVQGDPDAIILDAILPLGGVSAPPPAPDDAKSGAASHTLYDQCTGRIILNQFSALRSRTIVLSVLPENTLIAVGFPRDVAGYFLKADLGCTMDQFRAALRKLAAQEVIHG